MRGKRVKFDVEEWIISNQALFESIDYDVNVQGDNANEDEIFRKLIVATLAHIPEEVREKILSETIFIMASDNIVGTIFDLKFIEPTTLHWILLNFSSMKRMSDSRKMDMIAHEIAHCWLDHGLPGPAERENDTDDLVEKWGFKRVYLHKPHSLNRACAQLEFD